MWFNGRRGGLPGKAAIVEETRPTRSEIEAGLVPTP